MTFAREDLILQLSFERDIFLIRRDDLRSSKRSDDRRAMLEFSVPFSQQKGRRQGTS